MEEGVLMKRIGAYVAALAVVMTSTTVHAGPTKDECINANESAQSLRAAGKLRDAKAKLTLCTARTCPGPIRDDCSEGLNDLQKVMPTVVFAVRSVGGADLLSVRVKMDGAVLTTRLDGAAVAVDPGQHTFTFEADGFAPFVESLLIREGEKARTERVVLQAMTPGREPVPVASPPTRGPVHETPPPPSEPASLAPAPPPKPAPSEAPAEPEPARPKSHTSPARVTSYVAFGVGVAGVAAGSISGGMAMANKSALGSHCDGNACPSSERSDINGLRSNGTISTIGFGVGIVGLAAGTVLFLVSRHHEPSRTGTTVPLVSVGLGGAAVKVSFQ